MPNCVAPVERGEIDGEMRANSGGARLRYHECVSGGVGASDVETKEDAAETLLIGAHSGPPSGVPTIIAGSMVGRYVVLDVIGAGGMGTVVRAYDPKLRREVALKRLKRADDEAKARAIREAQAMAQLRHPNVVTVFDVEVGDEGVVMVMEYVPGTTLREWLKRQTRSWTEILDIFQRAGRGLAAAHAVGLVHRDFKPANVLIAEDGRVEVTDFGLAKLVEGELSGDEAFDALSSGSHATAIARGRRGESVPSLSGSSWNLTLTDGRLVMGTPRYMAPEQHVGEATIARSDQYAFCVALWEALCHEPPFRGPKFLAAKDAGPPPWPRQIDLPEKIVAALRRGLSPSPEDRFDSMDTLLQALALDVDKRDRRLLWATGATVFVAAGGLAGYLWHASQSPLCTGASIELEGIWDPARAAAVRQAIFDTEVVYANQAWTQIERQLDDYSREWATQHREACEQTTVRGEQSSDVLDMRMACLWRAKVQLAASVELLARADAQVAEKAVQMLDRLPPLSRCSDLERLRADVPPPDDPVVATRVEAVREELASAISLLAGGKYPQSEALLATLAPKVEELNYPPLAAELKLEQATVAYKLGAFDAGETLARHALRLALELGMQEVAIKASAALVYVVGQVQRRHGEAQWLGVVGLALARAFDPDGALEATMHSAQALLAGVQGHLAEAEASDRRAIEIRERVLGVDHLLVARARMNLAIVLRKSGNLREAEREYLRALAVQQQVLGRAHPETGLSRLNWGVVLKEQKRYDEAEQQYREALDILRASLGSEHPTIAAAHTNLGALLHEQGRNEEGEAEHRQALKIQERVFGPDHPDLAVMRLNIGLILRANGRYDAAAQEYREAIRILDAAYGFQHPMGAHARELLGKLLHEKFGERESALELLEAAWAVRSSTESAPKDRASSAFWLARVLWDDPAQRARAHTLASEASAIYSAQGAEHEGEREAVEKWLTDHQAP